MKFRIGDTLRVLPNKGIGKLKEGQDYVMTNVVINRDGKEFVGFDVSMPDQGFFEDRFELIKRPFKVGDVVRGILPSGGGYLWTTDEATCEVVVVDLTQGDEDDSDIKVKILSSTDPTAPLGHKFDVMSKHFELVSPAPEVSTLDVNQEEESEVETVATEAWGNDGYVKNVSSNAKNLTKGGGYIYKLDPDGTFRVKGNDGKWSKYGQSNFVPIDVTEFLLSAPLGVAKPPTPTADENVIEQIKQEEEHKQMTPATPAKPKVVTLKSALLDQGVSEKLIDAMADARSKYVCDDSVKHRIPKLGLADLFQGAELWNTCITAILCGTPILLSGGKATGKNTLANSLAMGFGRPVWDVSFHSSIGVDELVGTETFKNNEVQFNPGALYMAVKHNGFAILDEINMAKDSAIAVLNSMLDNRRVIDVPGYETYRISTADTVFIGTMNYGYAGTRPLNEALASRFVVPTIVEPNKKELVKLLQQKANGVRKQALELVADLLLDLRLKAQNGEISTAPVDLRGILNAIDMTELSGLSFNHMLTTCLANKAFEEMERKLVQDVINLKFPKNTYFDGSVLFMEEAKYDESLKNPKANTGGRQIEVKF